MDKAERRRELLRAARDVFASKGYHDAKVDDIVARAGVAKGTFYLYFSDKRSVFAELVDGLFGRIGGAILRVDVSTDIQEQIKHNIRAVVAVLLDDTTVTQLLLSQANALDPAYGDKVRSFYDGVHLLLRESLAEGQRLGIVADGDAAFFATCTLGMLKEILLDLAEGRRTFPREQIVDRLFAVLGGGYLRVELPPAGPPPAVLPDAPEVPGPEPRAPEPAPVEPKRRRRR